MMMDNAGSLPNVPPLPGVDGLRCFSAAARTLNFRKAARLVSLTPQAFSYRISALEEELGVRLFERTTRSVQLTVVGLKLLTLVEKALAALDECASVGKQAGSPAPLSITLGTRHELGLSWLEPSLKELREELPWLSLHLYFGSGRDILQQLRDGQVDCAVTSARLDDPGLIGLELHREEYAFVAAPSCLRRHPLRRAEDASEHTLIDVDQSLPLYRYWRDSAPSAGRLQFARVWRLGAGEAVRRGVLRGEGVAVLPKYLIEGDLRSGRMQVLFPKHRPLHDSFRLVVRDEDVRRPLLELLAAALRRRPLR